MFEYNNINAPEAPMAGKSKFDSKCSALRIAALAIATSLATGSVLADKRGEGEEALISFHANTAGETVVFYGPGYKPLDYIETQEATLEVPKVVLNALNDKKRKVEILYIVETKKKGIFKALRCHMHPNGEPHCR